MYRPTDKDWCLRIYICVCVCARACAVPGPVRHLSVIERGSHHLKLSWQPPIEINGILTGYDIRYKEGQLLLHTIKPVNRI